MLESGLTHEDFEIVGNTEDISEEDRLDLMEPENEESQPAHQMPGALRQLRNFQQARNELKENQYRVNPVQRLALLGMMTLVPDEVRGSGILQNPQRLQAIDALVDYEMCFNDKLDLTEAPGISEEVAGQALENEQASGQRLNESLGQLPEDQAEQLRNYINQGLAEMQFYEQDMRRQSLDGQLSLGQAEQYRNAVNAINGCLINASIFGTERFADRLAPIQPNQMSMDAITQKYQWLNGNVAHDQVEQAMMISHQMAMATQVIDDWRGRDNDAALGVPSLARAALQQTNGNERQAWSLLKQQKSEYRHKAQDLGLSYAPAKGALVLFGGAMRFQRIMIRYLQNHPDSRLHERMQGRIKLREQAQIQGKLASTV